MFTGSNIEYNDEIVIKNNGFWPDLNMGEFQRRRFIPSDLDVSLLTETLLAVAGEINELLIIEVNKHQANGYTSSANVPGVNIEEENHITAQYKKAVYARAKADLLPSFASLGRRNDNPSQESRDTVAGLIAESSRAIRSLKGLSRVGVSLL